MFFYLQEKKSTSQVLDDLKNVITAFVCTYPEELNTQDCVFEMACYFLCFSQPAITYAIMHKFFECLIPRIAL
jgi:hypothetical protein